MNIRSRIVLFSVLSVAALGLVIGVVWHRADRDLQEQQLKLVRQQAVAVGETIAAQVAATRAVYTEHIVKELKPHGIKFASNPAVGEAPLPAVFMTHVSEKLASQGSGHASFVLRSGWNINPEQGIETDFEKEAWANLLTQKEASKDAIGEDVLKPYKPYWKEGTLEDGSPVIRVMTSDIAGVMSCVSCHNALEATDQVLAMRGSSTPIQFQLGDLMGAVVTTVPTAHSKAIVAELAQTQASVSRWIWGALVIGVLFACVLGVLAGRNISGKVQLVTERIGDMAAGDADLTKRLEIHANDEIGELSGQFNKFAGRMQDLVRDIAGNANTVSSASTRLADTAAQLTEGATEGTTQSSTVAAAAEQMAMNMENAANETEGVANNVKEVASSIGEMTTTINEIAKNAEQAAAIANEAVDLNNSSNDKISTVGDAADEIGKMIEVIQDIAEQTNLLALNATIEAARAGESGKGFAVVATEVKELAKQTATATDDIRHRIESMQGSTSAAVDAIQQVNGVIQDVSNVSRTIAAAVEEQNVTVKLIAMNVADTTSLMDKFKVGVAESATASREITASISQVDQFLKKTANGAKLSQDASKEFAQVSGELQRIASQFKFKNDDMSTVDSAIAFGRVLPQRTPR